MKVTHIVARVKKGVRPYGGRKLRGRRTTYDSGAVKIELIAPTETNHKLSILGDHDWRSYGAYEVEILEEDDQEET